MNGVRDFKCIYILLDIMLAHMLLCMAKSISTEGTSNGYSKKINSIRSLLYLKIYLIHVHFIYAYNIHNIVSYT